MLVSLGCALGAERGSASAHGQGAGPVRVHVCVDGEVQNSKGALFLSLSLSSSLPVSAMMTTTNRAGACRANHDANNAVILAAPRE